MSTDRSPARWADELAHDLQSALTVVKARAQLIRRVPWPTTAAHHQRLVAHAGGIDEAATAAARHLARLLAEHVRRWPEDDPAPAATPERPGAGEPPNALLDRVKQTQSHAPHLR